MLSVAVGLRPAWQTGLITDTVRLAGVPSLGQRYACPSRRWRRRSFTCSLAVIPSQLAGTLYQYLTIRAAILTCSQADISQKRKNQKVQKAQLSPRDRATRRVSWNRAKCRTDVRWIAFDTSHNRRMTFKVIQSHRKWHESIGLWYFLLVSILHHFWYYHIYGVCDWRWGGRNLE